MKPDRDHLEALERRLDYHFADRRLLQEALTHASVGEGRDNQRLEFLGDALLGFAVAFLLHREHPDWKEGPLSKLRGVLVRTESLHDWARGLCLEEVLRAAHPRKAPPMGAKPLADALEALVAALYLDATRRGQDGMALVLRLAEARLLPAIQEARPESWIRTDPKTHLQELAARQGLPAPVYTLVEQTGPGHAPRFTLEVAVGEQRARATGSSRKRAEGEAARQLVASLQAPTDS